MEQQWEACRYLERGTSDDAFPTRVVDYTDLKRPFTVQPLYLDVEPRMFEVKI